MTNEERAMVKENYGTHRTLCQKCNWLRPNDQFSTKKRVCDTCLANQPVKVKEKRVTDPRHLILGQSKTEAITKHLPHELKLSDVAMPSYCKFMGTRLDYKLQAPMDDAPIIDRIDRKLGYVPGNVQTISCLASRIKGEASIEQLRAFANSFLAVYG